MWKMIMNGEELSEFHKKSKIIVDDIINGIGVMSESQKKEAEYKIVSAITLVTRYAIMSGVDDSAAYALSDVSLQKLSKAKNVLEMEDVFKQAMLKFIELNQISRKKGGIYSPSELFIKDIFRRNGNDNDGVYYAGKDKDFLQFIKIFGSFNSRDSRIY